MKELQREHEEGLREKMAELGDVKSQLSYYMQKYDALVDKPALMVIEVRILYPCSFSMHVNTQTHTYDHII